MRGGDLMSIKRKIFTLTFFTATIPILVISTITFFIFSRKIKEVESQKMNLISQNIEKTVQGEINASGEILEYLSDRYTKKRIGFNDTKVQVDNKIRLKRMIYHMKNITKSEKNIKFIAFGSPDKKMIFDNLAEDQNLPSDYDPTTRPWYIGALNSKGIYLSEVFIHAGTGNPIVTLSKKIELKGEIIGVLMAMIDFSYIESEISKFKIGNTGSFFIVDKNNKILVDGGDNQESFNYISKMDLFSKNHLEIIKYISETDSLTGCYNRRAIINLIEKEIEQSKEFDLNFYSCSLFYKYRILPV